MPPGARMADYTPSEIAQFAPDAAAFKSAQQLSTPNKWQRLRLDDTGGTDTIRGDHQGSGDEPYHARVDVSGPHFRCSCPSRKQPCKHALALFMLYAAQPELFGDEVAPIPTTNDDVFAPGSLFGPPLDAATPPDISPAVAASSANSNDGMSANVLPSDWAAKLSREFALPYFAKLREFVNRERAQETVYPAREDVFNAFKHTPYEQANVLILGQDPYHGPRQAHGLAFSVQPKVPTPPSLQNIFQELKSELGLSVPNNGYLVPWAEQGVMMLNAVLTVRRSEPNSHKSQGWEKFTDAAIKALNERDSRVVFVLWGAYARKKKLLIDTSRHVVVESAHPSPLSAHTGFFGSKPFSQVNAALREVGKPEINWQIPNL